MKILYFNIIRLSLQNNTIEVEDKLQNNILNMLDSIKNAQDMLNPLLCKYNTAKTCENITSSLNKYFVNNARISFNSMNPISKHLLFLNFAALVKYLNCTNDNLINLEDTIVNSYSYILQIIKIFFTIANKSMFELFAYDRMNDLKIEFISFIETANNLNQEVLELGNLLQLVFPTLNFEQDDTKHIKRGFTDSMKKFLKKQMDAMENPLNLSESVASRYRSHFDRLFNNSN